MKKYQLVLLGLSIMGINRLSAQNPIIQDQFTADPTARVFNDKVYLYPSHDIPAPSGAKLRKDWFCMEDYHVFSSDNLTDWKDHGVIVRQNKVTWVDSTSYSMWAPDCIFKNGKYYFYFPAPARDTTYGRGFSIGVSVSDIPYGPFVSQPEPIKNVKGIDPNVFIDKDGQAYLYWSARNIYVARLKDNMTELASEPQVIANLPEKGLKEGPFMFERNGIYYLTFPHVANAIERLEYAMGNNPMGPFKMAGVVMDESPNGCWTNHHSFIQLKNQWYLFYHGNDLSPKFDKNRSVRIDSMFFNADGTIRKVLPTLRGVGLTDATSIIQLDRYSCSSKIGVSTAFLDTTNTFKGWKVVLEAKNSWVQYNGVECKPQNLKKVRIRCHSTSGAEILLRVNNANGPAIAKVEISNGNTWNIVEAPVIKLSQGIQNIVAQLNDGNHVEIDWISFK